MEASSVVLEQPLNLLPTLGDANSPGAQRNED